MKRAQEKPILFSAPMIQAILRNAKSQTRRVLMPQPAFNEHGCWYPRAGTYPGKSLHYGNEAHFRRGVVEDFCPYFAGQTLWVRETWAVPPGSETLGDVVYRADVGDLEEEASIRRLTGRKLVPWKPSIFMPRWASRITLQVESTRIERLQDITEDDAKAEGCPGCVQEVRVNGSPAAPGYLSGVYRYAALWNSINGKRPGCSWKDNPWVYVFSFSVLSVRGRDVKARPMAGARP